MAVKGDDTQNPTTIFNYINISNLFNDYVQKPVTAIADNVMIFNSNKNAVDSGHAIATDAEFTDMLDEVLPVA